MKQRRLTVPRHSASLSYCAVFVDEVPAEELTFPVGVDEEPAAELPVGAAALAVPLAVDDVLAVPLLPAALEVVLFVVLPAPEVLVVELLAVLPFPAVLEVVFPVPEVLFEDPPEDGLLGVDEVFVPVCGCLVPLEGWCVSVGAT